MRDMPNAQCFDVHRPGLLVQGFGFARAGAGALKPLLAHLPTHLGLAEFVMPGRGRRVRETPVIQLDRLCQQACEAVAATDQPLILLGYSLGALLAFETAHLLQSAGRPPAALVVCALNAPQHLAAGGEVHRLPLPALRDHLATLGGTPDVVLRDLDVLACFAPGMRADYELIETYRYVPRERLRCPIVTLAGTRDPLTGMDEVHAWSALTTRHCTTLWVEDIHFFLDRHSDRWQRAFQMAANAANASALFHTI